MSNRLFQGIVHQLEGSVDRMIGVIDDSCTIISCSELGKIGEVLSEQVASVFIKDEPMVFSGITYQSFGTPMHPEYAVFVEGEDDVALKYLGILAVSFSNIKQFYDEKYDRATFIKNILLENILPGDIYLKARELQIENDVLRVAMLFRSNERIDVEIYDIIQSIFPEKNKDFVININGKDIVLVKEVREEDYSDKNLEKLARSVADSLGAEYYSHITVGIGNVVDNIKGLARSFREAQIALEVGKVFDTEKTIISYDNLGIARLVYQLPTTLCKAFLDEVFRCGTVEALDPDTLFTIQKFFENNLNVSETSRRLFVHRNTLVYRLEKIRKLTGLDLRSFDDAIVFKVALMVKKYLDSDPIKY